MRSGLSDPFRKPSNRALNWRSAPELAVAGYLPRDLLLRPAFIDSCWNAVQQIARALSGSIPLLVGVPLKNSQRVGRPLFNAAVLIKEGQVRNTFYKTLMPTYDVFDEDRYFEPGVEPQILEIAGRRLGVSICEDLWNDRDFWERPRYHVNPIEALAKAGVEAILNLSSSPFTVGKQRLRERMLGAAAQKYNLPILYCNQVGGNDDLVFDGRSLAIDAQGRVRVRGKAFEEDIVIVDLPTSGSRIVPADSALEPGRESVWRAAGAGNATRLCP